MVSRKQIQQEKKALVDQLAQSRNTFFEESSHTPRQRFSLLRTPHTNLFLVTAGTTLLLTLLLTKKAKKKKLFKKGKVPFKLLPWLLSTVKPTLQFLLLSKAKNHFLP